jgi:sugar O-acyltransferase (sialic acid O-acetyltransferase NeuD family)
LEVIFLNKVTNNLAFYDDVSTDVGDFLYNEFPILKKANQVQDHFLKSNTDFTVCIGNPKLRYKLHEKFIKLGGNSISLISPLAQIGHFDVKIGDGTIVLSSSNFSNSTSIGKGSLVYYNVVVTHDCVLGDFVELSPGATILGRCKIGDFTKIGANATILPDLKIGRNVLIGAGAVVTRDLPDNAVAVGIPAKIIRYQEPFPN